MSNNPTDESFNSFLPPPFETAVAPNGDGNRKEVFRVLVLLQDLGETVEVSRARVEVQFGISRQELLGIEREGIAMNWPPL